MQLRILYLISVACLCLLSAPARLFSQQTPDFTKSPTKFTIDLRDASNDQLAVSAIPSPLLSAKDTIFYVTPAIAPGTYARYDFGRFITNFRAIAVDGGELPVTRRSVNEFAIATAKGRRLKSVEYKINDSFDDTTKPFIFQPSGTNIHKDTNYVLNFPGVCGYFDGLKRLPIILEIDKPAYMSAATSLNSLSRSDEKDVFFAENYDELIDNPIMYSRPDTVVYTEGNAKITIAAYSANGKIKAADIAKYLRPQTIAARQFLGAIPVEHYTFIMYFADPARSDITRNVMSTGALEHSHCSFYFLTETDNSTMLENMIQHVAAHEFLHILAPLHLHSREIDDFDFIEPKMSEHLWLYEGVTEYFANLALLKGGLINHAEFRARIKQKLSMSAMMSPKPFSMTEFSRNILTAENQKLYPIIYEKGAVSGFLLDILLNESTRGKLSLVGLIQKLSAKYGPNKPFEDKELFNIIGKESPIAERYLRSYVDSAKALPVKELLDKIGWTYDETRTATYYSFGALRLKPNTDSTALVVSFSFSDNKLNLEDSDEVNTIDGAPVSTTTYKNMAAMITHPQSGNAISLTAKRGDKIVNLTGAPTSKEQKEQNVISVKKELTPEQIELQKWIFGEAEQQRQ